MPELGEQMYCSQQICIPPTFPYLLRQFAKAAIRTQPSDLLKWASTYFRCLSLNVPPPVKPRLEYPMPRDHHGMTPGWLKALLNQMCGVKTVPFKLLWERWIGACLQHPNLIQILVLGGFDDNMAIPWLRFVGLCAAHLTENLTQTMILICEILTEEPEGASASIPLEVFLDLYQFLARINASFPQTLRNYYFLDKFLELYQEKIIKDSGVKPPEEETEEEALSVVSSETSLKSDRGTGREDDGSVVSCPSVGSQDADNYMKLLMKIREAEEGEYDEAEIAVLKQEAKALSMKSSVRSSLQSDRPPQEPTEEPSEEEQEEAKPKEPKKFADQLAEDAKVADVIEKEETESKTTKSSSLSEKSSEKEGFKLDDDRYLMEDLERLKAVQQELLGEDDDEIEKFKARLLADAGLTPSQIVAPTHFEGKIGERRSEEEIEGSVKSQVASSETSGPKEPVDDRDYEDVDVDAVPGIGPKIPEEIIAAVCAYMREVASIQHGMVMPRNIRHYECPPLEFYDEYKDV